MDLQAIFDELNAEYFGGELPATVRLDWGFPADCDEAVPEDAIGLAILDDDRVPHIYLSERILNSGDSYVGRVMLHEMVHVKVADYEPSTEHLTPFVEECKRISALKGYSHATIPDPIKWPFIL